jgi:hypothetical protein
VGEGGAVQPPNQPEEEREWDPLLGRPSSR